LAGPGANDSDAYFITNAADCLLATPRTFDDIQIAAGTTAGNLVDIVVDVPTNAVANATAPIYNIVNQFSAEIIPVNTTLDFTNFQEDFVQDGGPEPPSTPTTLISRAGIIITSDESIPALNRVALNPVAGGCLDEFIAGDGITIEMMGGLAGLSNLNYDGDTYAFTPSDITNGEATASPTAGEVKVCRSNDPLASAKTPSEKAVFLDLTSDGLGNGVPIEVGARTVNVRLQHGSGDIAAGVTRSLASGTSHTLGLDATTFFLPLIVFDPPNSNNTFTKLNSSSLVAGANGVTGMILTDDGTYANCTFGTITAGTALEISGADWDSCITNAGKTADLVVGRSAIITVNAAQANVQGLTKQTFSGNLTDIPMQILNGTRGE
jgi:hypothetical protein